MKQSARQRRASRLKTDEHKDLCSTLAGKAAPAPLPKSTIQPSELPF
jgi:hypothetical protein